MIDRDSSQKQGSAGFVFDAAGFLRASGRVLSSIERALSDIGIELEVDFVSEGVLEVEFADGAKMIINRHAVSQEVWVAGRTGGFHFQWDGEHWTDTRTQEELFFVVSRLASQMSGQTISLQARERT